MQHLGSKNELPPEKGCTRIHNFTSSHTNQTACAFRKRSSEGNSEQGKRGKKADGNGNEKQLSSSQAHLGQDIKSAVA